MKSGREDCRNLDHARSLEWLKTDARGGFSAGMVANANTRRYHALLLTARSPPIGTSWLIAEPLRAMVEELRAPMTKTKARSMGLRRAVSQERP